MTREDRLKSAIMADHRSVREFCLEAGIPYSSLVNMLRRGLNNSSLGNVLLVCRKLSIDVNDLMGTEYAGAELRAVTRLASGLNGDGIKELTRCAEKLLNDKAYRK